MDLGFDQLLNFPNQLANSLIYEPESFKDVHLQHFGADCSVRSEDSNMESPSDLLSAVNGFLLARSAAFAQRRWTMLFSVLKWFSIWRIVAKKKPSHVSRRQRHC
ncbi:hypothetical protein U1Q18_007863 [Sarracenia purpurea var. burkii]